MGYGIELWKRLSRTAMGVKVRGTQYLELRMQGSILLLNVAAREPDMEKIEEEMVKEWGDHTLMHLMRIRELLLEEPGRRDMIAPCFDNVDETIPLSCISVVHVMMNPSNRLKSGWQVYLNVYARSIHVDRLDRDVEFLKDVLAWLIEPLDEFYWEDYDPVLCMRIASLHKEVHK